MIFLIFPYFLNFLISLIFLILLIFFIFLTLLILLIFLIFGLGFMVTYSGPEGIKMIYLHLHISFYFIYTSHDYGLQPDPNLAGKKITMVHKPCFPDFPNFFYISSYFWFRVRCKIFTYLQSVKWK